MRLHKASPTVREIVYNVFGMTLVEFEKDLGDYIYALSDDEIIECLSEIPDDRLGMPPMTYLIDQASWYYYDWYLNAKLDITRDGESYVGKNGTVRIMQVEGLRYPISRLFDYHIACLLRRMYQVLTGPRAITLVGTAYNEEWLLLCAVLRKQLRMKYEIGL